MQIQFEIRGSVPNKETKIYARFKIPNGPQVRVSTGLFVAPKDWSISKKRCIARDPFLKNINSSLELISANLIREISMATDIVDKDFCERVIKATLNRTDEEDTDTLVGLQQLLIDEAPTKVVKQKMGLSESTIVRYKTFMGVIQSFDEYKGSVSRLTDIDKKWESEFLNWCNNIQKYSPNYTGRSITRIRQLANEAEKRGLKVSPYAKHMKSFKQKAEERIIHTLTLDEIDLIKACKDLPPFLINARKWLLIALNTGNRVSDLMALRPDSFRYYNDILICDVLQQKTKEFVSIPIIDEDVKALVEGGFPHPISEQKFNDYIKELAKRAGVDEEVEGNRRIDGEYQKIVAPKYKFLSSHAFRRTFATLAIDRGIPHHKVMGITGHRTLDVFLSYVNKEMNKDDAALDFAKYLR